MFSTEKKIAGINEEIEEIEKMIEEFEEKIETLWAQKMMLSLTLEDEERRYYV